MRRRPIIAAILAIGLVVATMVGLASRPAGVAPPGRAAQIGASPATTAGPTPTPSPPIPGHEVYGFVPYWEMDKGIAAHLATIDLTTVALFSVTHGRTGALATGERGYRAIDGAVGRQIVREAHDRRVRVELVYTSFGKAKNAAFFGDLAIQDRAIGELVALVDHAGVDGINVDVEQMDPGLVPAYGLFVGRLRDAVRAAHPAHQVSVAATGGEGGAAMALAASLAGADRIFLMGYDYHWSGSGPGASAPLSRRDENPKTLGWSLDLYRDIGVPVDRTVLGLPLYGMSWPVASPQIGAHQTGPGAIWIPRQHLGVLAGGPSKTTYDPLESVAFLSVPNGSTWKAIYFDSPDSLTPKLALADERGLAGAGFWAVGYERGLSGYGPLIESFRSGHIAARARVLQASMTDRAIDARP